MMKISAKIHEIIYQYLSNPVTNPIASMTPMALMASMDPMAGLGCPDDFDGFKSWNKTYHT